MKKFLFSLFICVIFTTVYCTKKKQTKRQRIIVENTVTIEGQAPLGTWLFMRTWGDLDNSGTVDLFDASKLQQGWVEYKVMQSTPLFEPRVKAILGTWKEMVDQWRGPLYVIK